MTDGWLDAVVRLQAENNRMRHALEMLLGWDQMQRCCPEGSPFHNGHNPDITWARRLITDALGVEQMGRGDAS